MQAGFVARSLEPVEAAFAAVLAGQRGTGAALAVWGEGRWLVDLWGGSADAAGHRAWGRDSIVQPYSVSKPFVAVCALLLVQRGELELDAAVERYWPEFRAKATVRQLLSHQAGVVALGAPAPTELFFDWDEMCRRLAAEPPVWEPGTAIGESALFYGHLVGELVRRADGRGFGAFLRDEVTAPLGLDFAFGLSGADQARAVELTGLDEEASGIDRVFGEPAAFGLGFGIDDDGFGMGGLGGSFGAASRDGYAIAFVTGSMGSHDRAIMLENTVRRCLGLPALNG